MCKFPLHPPPSSSLCNSELSRINAAYVRSSRYPRYVQTVRELENSNRSEISRTEERVEYESRSLISFARPPQVSQRLSHIAHVQSPQSQSHDNCIVTRKSCVCTTVPRLGRFRFDSGSNNGRLRILSLKLYRRKKFALVGAQGRDRRHVSRYLYYRLRGDGAR